VLGQHRLECLLDRLLSVGANDRVRYDRDVKQGLSGDKIVLSGPSNSRARSC
jgi:hypothetical protein